MRISITYLLTVFVSVLLVILGHNFAVKGIFSLHDNSIKPQILRAVVQSTSERIKDTNLNQDFEYVSNEYDDDFYFDDFFTSEKIYFEAKVKSGPRKGEIIRSVQSFNNITPDRSKEVKKGDSVSLINFGGEWLFNGYYRINKLIGLGILFVACVFFFGRKKGFNTILSLGLTCAAIFAVFIPSILSGKNVYLMAILVCIYTTAMTLLIVIGYNKKSFAAAVGCLSGILVTGIITIIMDKVLLLTGIVDEHSRYLINLPVDPPINLRAIIFAGIIIGAMGAIMDVAMSISSSLWELKEKAGRIKFKEMLRSGLNIGRDIFGTMANTLILAYIGTSLTIVLILSVFSNSLENLFNMEMIAVEVLQALAGSFGILFAMPLTAFFCSVLYLKKRRE